MPTFVILAHREPALVTRLAERLSPHPVVVHVDKKVDLGRFAAELAPLLNVTVVPERDRVEVNWAGFSMLRATMAGFTAALPLTAADDHVVLLSGQDYPIKPIAQFVEYLRDAPHRQHIRMFEITPEQPKYYRHLTGRYMQDLHLPGRLDHPQARRVALRLVRDSLGRRQRRLPDSTRFTFGSQWVALTGECMRWVVDNFDRSPAARFTSHSFAPDEKTIHSMVANSPFAAEMPGGEPEPFSGNGTYRLANFHLIDPSLNKIFDLHDFDLVASSDRFFVRKLTSESVTLADRIDDELLSS